MARQRRQPPPGGTPPPPPTVVPLSPEGRAAAERILRQTLGRTHQSGRRLYQWTYRCDWYDRRGVQLQSTVVSVVDTTRDNHQRASRNARALASTSHMPACVQRVSARQELTMRCRRIGPIIQIAGPPLARP